MAGRRKFRDNSPEEMVTIGKGEGVIRSTNTITIPEPDTSLPDTVVDIDMPQPMERPVLKPDYQPKLVAPKVVVEKIDSQDENIMNAGMEVLMEYLPEDTRDLIREYLLTSGVPLWQAIGGYVMRSREEAALFAPIILPDWADAVRPNAVRACGTCGEGMKARVGGQKFCCNFCYHGRSEHNPNCSLVVASV